MVVEENKGKKPWSRVERGKTEEEEEEECLKNKGEQENEQYGKEGSEKVYVGVMEETNIK